MGHTLDQNFVAPASNRLRAEDVLQGTAVFVEGFFFSSSGRSASSWLL